MTVVRCIQNFNRRRALIVSEDPRALGRLDDYLIRLGVRVQHLDIHNSSVDLTTAGVVPDDDVLFLDGDLNCDICVPTYPDSEVSIVPVIGMVGIEAPSRLGTLFAHGATAFIKKPIHVGTVFSSLFMAINSHVQQQSCLKRIESMEQRRHLRRYVVKAVILLMKHYSVDDEAAYSLLRTQSMRAQSSIENFSKRLVERQHGSACPDYLINDVAMG